LNSFVCMYGIRRRAFLNHCLNLSMLTRHHRRDLTTWRRSASSDGRPHQPTRARTVGSAFHSSTCCVVGWTSW
jgi:hypothetical protein